MQAHSLLMTLRMRKPFRKDPGSLLLIFHHVRQGAVFEQNELGFLKVQFPLTFLLDVSYVVYLQEAQF